MPDLLEQLRDEAQRSDKSLAELVERAQLECSSYSLGRKLNGKQAFRLDEAAALARALGRPLTLGQRKRAA